jgi:hypothetical protein
MRRALISLLVLFAACGKTNSLADAPRGDGAGADAQAPIDATTAGPVTVVTYSTGSGGGIASGVPVVFVQPNGTIAAEVPSDGSGVATATVLPGASVTAAYTSTAGGTLYTVTAVKPGDHINIGPFNTGTVTVGTFTANVAPAPGATQYQVYGPCGSSISAAAGSGSATPVTLQVYDYCQQAKMDLLAVALSPTVLGYLEANMVTFADGGQTDMTGTWQPLQTTNANYTNAPNDGSLSSIGFLAHVPDSDGYETTQYNAVSGGSATASLSLPVAASSLYETQLQSSNVVSYQDVFVQNTGTPAQVAMDVGATMLPWLAVPTLDPATGKITTTVTGTGGGDIFDVDVSYSRVVNTTTISYEWLVFGPAPGDVTLPPLPADLADATPKAGDQVSLAAYADLYDVDAISGYDQIREHLFDGLQVYFAGRATAPGRLRWSYSQPNLGIAPRSRRVHRR